MRYIKNYEHQYGNLPINQIRFIIAEILLIIIELHDSGIAHLDIKPENFLLNNLNHVIVIDFGISKVFPTIKNRIFYQKVKGFVQESNNKLLRGTIYYMSPEMIQNHDASFEADYWA